MISQSIVASHWPTSRLGEVVEFLDHLRQPITAKDRSSGPYPYYGANGQQDSVDGWIFDEPLVLLAEDGGNFEDASRPIAYPIDGKCWVNNHAHVLRPGARIVRDFLYWQLAFYNVTPFISGSTRAKLNKGAAERIPLALPPLAEQQRLAGILNKADAIRRKRQEAIVLTEQLLRSTFLEMFGDPVSNPKRWPIESLGELATFTGGGTPSRSVPEYFDGATCWATSKDMKGEVLSDTEEHITDDAIQNSATKLVPPGTILVVVKSKILMHRLPVLVAAVPTCFGQDLKGLSLRDPGLIYYVARHMRIGQDTLLRRARGVNTEGLTLEHLAEYAVMQPPSEMIDRYVKFELATTKAARVGREARADADHLFQFPRTARLQRPTMTPPDPELALCPPTSTFSGQAVRSSTRCHGGRATVHPSPRGACVVARYCLEHAVLWVYDHDGDLRRPLNDSLATSSSTSAASSIT
jgi:type I restriction enzyme S subunit